MVEMKIDVTDFERFCQGNADLTTNFSHLYHVEMYPKPIAVKMMQLQGTLTNDERVVREQEILERIKQDPERCDFVITPLASALTDVRAYIAFEWQPASLSNYNKQLQYSPRTYRRVLFQLAKALEYLHRSNIIHRDVKPSNVLLTSTNLALAQVRLADFGFARIHDLSESELTITRGIGTPAYAAPEIVHKSDNYTAKVDVWSYGVVAYEFLAGQKAFSGKNLMELAQAQAHGPNCTIDFRGGNRGECEEFLTFCLQVEEAKRPEMSEVLQHRFFSRAC